MRRWAALLAALAAGCAMAPPSAPPRPAAPAIAAPSTAERVLDALGRLKAMDERALEAEVAMARRAQGRELDDFSRLEAAMALSVSPSHDEAEVLALVAPLLRLSPPVAPELRAMAGFLQGVAYERRKLREGLAAAGAKARDERKEVLSQKLRADAQQERADRLQQKLEALTNLEKSLATRNADDPDRPPR